MATEQNQAKMVPIVTAAVMAMLVLGVSLYLIWPAEESNIMLTSPGQLEAVVVPPPPGGARPRAQGQVDMRNGDHGMTITRLAQQAQPDARLAQLPWLKMGETLPALEGITAEGQAIRLSAYAGKMVLLQVGAGDRNGRAWQTELKAACDRGGQDERFVVVRLDRPAAAPAADNAAVAQGKHILGRLAEQPKTSEEILKARDMICMIGPDGLVLSNTQYARVMYKVVDKGLPIRNGGRPGVKVTGEFRPMEEFDPEYRFTKVPSLSRDDAATGATFTVVNGPVSSNSGGVRMLNDGRGAPNISSPDKISFGYAHTTLEGRLLADLGRVMEIDQINTYAASKDWGRRVQVYRVYGSDGTRPGMNLAPLLGVDPEASGWTFLASVDSRTLAGMGGQGGQDAVSIHGTIGKYRYLLFLQFVTEIESDYGQTWFTEIDVVEKK